MIHKLKTRWLLILAAAVIAVAVIICLQRDKELEPEQTATPLTVALTPAPAPAQTAAPAETLTPAVSATQTPAPTPTPVPTVAPPALTYSPDAAAALPQDELEYTLADPTPAPADAPQEELQGTRNDNPDLREELELLIRLVRAELPGAWVGSFGDGIDWRLYLDPAYGNYELRIGDTVETGTFTMEHRIEAFHTTMHFMPDGQEPYDLDICLANYDGELCLIPKSAKYPTFYREE